MKSEPLHLPSEIPVMILPGLVLFPHSLLPLHIFEEKYRKMLTWSLEHARLFAIAPPLEPPDLQRDPSDIPDVIGVGLVRACVGKPDGTSDLILQGLGRAQVTRQIQAKPFRTVGIVNYPTFNGNPERVMELVTQLRAQNKILGNSGIRVPAQLTKYLESVDDPEAIGDLLAATFVESPTVRQELLAESDLTTRLEMVLAEMKLLAV